MLIIGEKINASIPSVKEAIVKKDEAFLAGLARDQADAGADFIDVNAGERDRRAYTCGNNEMACRNCAECHG